MIYLLNILNWYILGPVYCVYSQHIGPVCHEILFPVAHCTGWTLHRHVLTDSLLATDETVLCFLILECGRIVYYCWITFRGLICVSYSTYGELCLTLHCFSSLQLCRCVDNVKKSCYLIYSILPTFDIFLKIKLII